MRFSELIAKKDLTNRERDDLVTQARIMEGSLYDMEDLVTAIKGAGLIYRAGKLIAGKGSVTIDKDGVSLVPDGTAASQITWLAAKNDDEIARVYATVVGASPDRYGLVVIQAEPEAGSTNAASQGWVSLNSIDHDGAADDVTRGEIDLVGGVFSVKLRDTSETLLNYLNMTQTEHVINEQGADVDLRVEGDTVADLFKTDATNEQVSIGGFFNFKSISELTISGGVITATGSHHTVDTESDAGSDDLDTVNGGNSGDLLILRAADGARTVVCKDAVDNLSLAGDFSLDHQDDRIILMHDGTNWVETARSSNA